MVTKINRAGLQFLLIFPIAMLALTGCKPPGARALLAGKKRLDSGQPAAAIEPLQKAVNLLPDNADAWNYLGLAYHANNQPNEAAQAYQQALTLDPNLVEAYYSLGCLLLEQGNPAAAKTALTTYTMSQPRDANGWLRLASACWRTRDVSGAERGYAEALKLDNRNPEALNGVGLTLLSHNRATDAQAYFAAAVKVDSSYAPALLNLASVQHQYLGNKRAALQSYRDYLKLKPEPDNAAAVVAIATALEAELSPPKPTPPPQPPTPTPTPVVVVPKPVVPTPPKPKPTPPPVATTKTNPPPAAPKTNPPVAVVVTSPPPPVVEATNVAVAPSNPPPPAITLPLTNVPPPVVVSNPPIQIEVISNIPVRVAVTNPPPQTTPPATQTVTQVTKPLAPTPKSYQPYKYRAAIKFKPGNRSEAEKFFTQGLEAQKDKRLPDALTAFHAATQADPAYFRAYYNLGWTAYALKDWTTALEAYETALMLEPDSADTRFNFALALKQANHPQDAANELEILLTKRPNDDAAHLMLANLYAQQLNVPSLARPHYQKVLELNPRHPQATLIRYWLSENTP